MLNRDHYRINYSGLMRELGVIERDYLSILPSKLVKEYEEIQKTQQNFKGDAVFNVAARMVRLLHIKYLKLIKELETCEVMKAAEFPTQRIFTHTPLMIPSKTPGKVYVFPNLIVDSLDKTSLRNVCWVVCFDVLESFNKIRTVKPNSWSPFFRGWQKIKKYEELSIIRALTRYTNIRSAFSHKRIQALEAAYLETIAPLKLIYADKPKDYLVMFAVGGVSSCMTTTQDKKETWEIILKHKHHPMSLFAYHPYIKGVYTVKNKKVVARTLLYKDGAGKWQYGRIHAVDGIYARKFKEILLEEGYSELQRSFNRRVVFNVPGIYSRKQDDHFLPVPYMDNVRSGIHVEFDFKTNMFVVSFAYNGESNVSHTSTGGCVRASTLQNVKCGACGRSCRDRHNSWDGRYIFCNLSCAAIIGYVYARTATGESQLRLARGCYMDFFDSSIVFTSKNSCKRCGGNRVIHNYTIDYGAITAIQTDPEEFSRAGIFVTCDNERYCIHPSLWKQLKEKGVTKTGNRLICSVKGVVKGMST